MAYKRNGYRGNQTNSFREVTGLTGGDEVAPTKGGNDPEKLEARQIKLKEKASDRNWSTRKQLRKGVESEETTQLSKDLKTLDQNYSKPVWKKGEIVGAKSKVTKQRGDKSVTPNKSHKKIKTKVEESTGVPYGVNYTNKQRKALSDKKGRVPQLDDINVGKESNASTQVRVETKVPGAEKSKLKIY